MNGDWKLYLDDDLAVLPGSIAGGWKITFRVEDEYLCDVVPIGVNSEPISTVTDAQTYRCSVRQKVTGTSIVRRPVSRCQVGYLS